MPHALRACSAAGAPPAGGWQSQHWAELSYDSTVPTRGATAWSSRTWSCCSKAEPCCALAGRGHCVCHWQSRGQCACCAPAVRRHCTAEMLCIHTHTASTRCTPASWWTVPSAEPRLVRTDHWLVMSYDVHPHIMRCLAARDPRCIGRAEHLALRVHRPHPRSRSAVHQHMVLCTHTWFLPRLVRG